MIEYSHRTGYVRKPDCNKCGSGWSSKIIPNSIIFMSIAEICCIHDDRYECGATIEYKAMSDREMKNNILRKINSQPWYYPKRIARVIAQGYYEAVDKFGGPAYWDGKDAKS